MTTNIDRHLNRQPDDLKRKGLKPFDRAYQTFRSVEKQGDIISALFRLLIAVSIALSVFGLEAESTARSPLAIVSIIYGGISLIGLLLAAVKVRHPILPYVFVAADTVTVALALTVIGTMQHMDMGQTLSLPLFSLAFVILIHAALRYRPPLVLFGAILFVSLVFLLPERVESWRTQEWGGWSKSDGAWPDQSNGMMGDWSTHMASPMAGTSVPGTSIDSYFPLILLVLGSAILFVVVRRTKRLVLFAIRTEGRLTQLARFFSPEVAANLMRQEDDALPTGRRQHVAILFIDLRGFTRLSETMAPEPLTEMLGSFRSVVTQVVFDQGGTIDKFIGDAVLAVFGSPVSRGDDAKRAVEASFAISAAVREWFEERRRAGRSAALVGIGANYGEVFAGVIESGRVLEHTVLGDAVNVAERLERLTRTLDTNVVLSDSLVAASGIDPEEHSLRRAADVTIPGHEALITVYFSDKRK